MDEKVQGRKFKIQNLAFFNIYKLSKALKGAIILSSQA